MLQRIRMDYLAAWVAVVWIGVCTLCSVNVLGGEGSLVPEMPSHWKLITNFQVPAEQVKAMSSKLGAEFSSVRNIVYDVKGKRVQINVIVTPDTGNAEKLMTKLRSMKAEETLLQQGLSVYEFVGQNEALPMIAEGRKHLESK
jgi:hypothetical protein